MAGVKGGSQCPCELSGLANPRQLTVFTSSAGAIRRGSYTLIKLHAGVLRSPNSSQCNSCNRSAWYGLINFPMTLSVTCLAVVGRCMMHQPAAVSRVIDAGPVRNKLLHARLLLPACLPVATATLAAAAAARPQRVATVCRAVFTLQAAYKAGSSNQGSGSWVRCSRQNSAPAPSLQVLAASVRRLVVEETAGILSLLADPLTRPQLFLIWS